MALTDTEDLFNIALGLIGEYEVVEGNTSSKQYKLCNRFYARSRKEVLSLHPWNEAKKPKILLEDTTARIFGPARRYPRPSDALLILTINEDVLHWEDEGGWIITDHYRSPRAYSASSVKYIAGQYVSQSDVTYLVDTTFTSSDFTTDLASYMTSQSADLMVVHVEYIYDLTTISSFSPLLYNTIAYKLATKVVVAITNNPKAKVELTEELEKLILPTARSQDARQGRMRQYFDSSWIRSRSSGRTITTSDLGSIT